VNTYRTARFHTGEGWRCALVREGRTRLHLIVLEESGVRHLAAERSEARSLRPLPYHGADYPVARMVRKFAALGRVRGITQAALAELMQAGRAR